MEIFPYKIDWKVYKANFPSTQANWVLPMQSFPDRDLSGKNEAYSEHYEAMARHLPVALRKPLGLFVAATSVCPPDSVDFSPFAPEVEYNPEEYQDVPQPFLNPRQMTQVAKALAAIKANGYEDAIRIAWTKAYASGGATYAHRAIESADAFLEYLQLWIDAFDEVNRDKAVLGLGYA